MTNTEKLEALRTFAVSHGEIAFAHLCTAALTGEMWAVERMRVFFGQCNDWCLNLARMNAAIERDSVLDLIHSTDTTRPDGAIARKLEI